MKCTDPDRKKVGEKDKEMRKTIFKIYIWILQKTCFLKCTDPDRKKVGEKDKEMRKTIFKIYVSSPFDQTGPSQSEIIRLIYQNQPTIS